MEKLQRKKISVNQIRTYTVYLTLLLLWIVFHQLTGGNFITIRNLHNLINQMGPTAIVSIGICMCLITGNIDLSAGALIGTSGAILAVFISKLGLNPVLALAAMFGFCVLVGLWQGFWIAYKGIPAFIVTLSGQMVLKGLTLLITKGATISINNKFFSALGTGCLPIWMGYALAAVVSLVYIIIRINTRRNHKKYGIDNRSVLAEGILAAIVVGATFALVFWLSMYLGVPYVAVLLIVLLALFSFLLSKTKFGRYIYALGGNKKATYYAGVNYKAQLMKVYAFTGVLAGLAGFVLTSRLAGATPTSGTGLELDGVAACVIGGISLAGGKGKVIGTLVGALMMCTLNNGMSLLNLDSSLQYVVKGLVLLAAIWFDISGQKKAAV